MLTSLDTFFIQHAYTSTLTKGASVQLVFGFEYAILLTIVMNTLVKYVLHSIDLHSENPWENKAVFVLYTELAVTLVRVLLYILFFVIMVRIYTLPLFAVRPMYLTMRAFKKAFNDVVLSRRAIHNMDTLYPDATAEELAATDNVCIICREEMSASATKKLPCNHIFHRNCLRSWWVYIFEIWKVWFHPTFTGSRDSRPAPPAGWMCSGQLQLLDLLLLSLLRLTIKFY